MAYGQLLLMLLELDKQMKLLGRTPKSLALSGRPHAACVIKASYLIPTMTGLAGEHDRQAFSICWAVACNSKQKTHMQTGRRNSEGLNLQYLFNARADTTPATFSGQKTLSITECDLVGKGQGYRSSTIAAAPPATTPLGALTRGT